LLAESTPTHAETLMGAQIVLSEAENKNRARELVNNK